MSIEFTKQLQQLKELQQLDNQIRKISIELKEIPETLETRGKEYWVLSKSVQEKEKGNEVLNKERLNLEKELQDSIAFLQEREKRLNAITTPKEYQAAVKEVADAKNANKNREERILALMGEIEKNNEEIKQLKLGLSDKEGEFRKIEEELKGRSEGLHQEQESLEKKRSELILLIAPETLNKYDTVRGRFARGNALVEVKKGICQGCFMNIPHQAYNEMLKMTIFRYCPHCQRMVYAEIESAGSK